MSDRKRDGAKLSFSELDKLRRERKHGRSPDPRSERSANQSAQKNYRAALEQAFDSGRLAELAATLQRSRESSLLGTPRQTPKEPEVDGRLVAPASDAQADTPAGPGDNRAAAKRRPESPERAEKRKLAKLITEAATPRDSAAAIERYMERFATLPRDVDILEKALTHPKIRVVLHALERLESWVAAQKLKRSRSLAMQLTILEETHDDSEVRDRAARVRAAL